MNEIEQRKGYASQHFRQRNASGRNRINITDFWRATTLQILLTTSVQKLNYFFYIYLEA